MLRPCARSSSVASRELGVSSLRARTLTSCLEVETFDDFVDPYPTSVFGRIRNEGREEEASHDVSNRSQRSVCADRASARSALLKMSIGVGEEVAVIDNP